MKPLCDLNDKIHREKAIFKRFWKYRIFPNFQNRACCEKYLRDNKHSSLHSARKYARRFVLGHYLFLKAHSFPRSENCELWGTDNVPGQTVHLSIFSRQTETFLYILQSKMCNMSNKAYTFQSHLGRILSGHTNLTVKLESMKMKNQ